MKPIRIPTLAAVLALALMICAAIPAAAYPGDGGVPPLPGHFPGDGGVERFPGDGGVE